MTDTEAVAPQASTAVGDATGQGSRITPDLATTPSLSAMRPYDRPVRLVGAIVTSVVMFFGAIQVRERIDAPPSLRSDVPCQAPQQTAVDPTIRVDGAVLVRSGPMSLEDAVGGKYASDARRAALASESVVSARFEDWQYGTDLVSVRVLEFNSQQAALDYSAVDAETICAFTLSTFEPAGLVGGSGVRQPWENGPDGWWVGALADVRYVRSYVRTPRHEVGDDMAADAIVRVLSG